MNKESLIGENYQLFLKEIKEKITSARIQASRMLNRQLIALYLEIGRSIVERQEKFGWGKGVVEQLSRDLAVEHAGFEGFSPDNLWRMRMLYLAYKDNAKLAQLVPELPWGHNILILQKVKDAQAKEYYISAGINFGWSRNVLLNQIKAGAYQLSLKRKDHNFVKALPAHLSEQAEESLKSVYNMEYALRSVKNPMGVAQYCLTSKAPLLLRRVLPPEKDFKKRFLEEMK